MQELVPGLYDTLITSALAKKLGSLNSKHTSSERKLNSFEASDRLALHLSQCIARAIDSVADDKKVELGVALVSDVINAVEKVLDQHSEHTQEQLNGNGNILHSVSALLPTGKPAPIEAPKTPLIDTTLLVNAKGEPNVKAELISEIDSAERIDVVMAFVRYSGIRPFIESLQKHTGLGRSLRLLTTTYTGSTEARALDRLHELGAQIRVSYDTTSTRLHAKAWMFHRQSAFDTAYVGSSNLTHAALVDGIEWNVRASAARNPDLLAKVSAAFNTYWEDDSFEPYDAERFAEHERIEGKASHTTILPPTELHARPFQIRLLEQIAVSRQQGFHRNLLVSATGTGKTVMAALDYASLIQDRNPPRLLFVAHRVEILEQALGTFRHALRNSAFGELWNGNSKPVRFDHVFASIQTLRGDTLKRIDATQFDVLIIDEFHHAAAASYKALLQLIRPKELLGLTATPERSDGLSILDEFDGRIAAQYRLWDAIEQHTLTPFNYYGIADETDLRNVKWSRHQGYDIEGLSNVLTANDAIARRVLEQTADHVEKLSSMKALGFCVSVAHARFMSRVFNQEGVRAQAIWADSKPTERREALVALANGDIQVLFSVDLFNEGVDIPDVDTLIMLRPTESGTVFIQQLGRGLRKSNNKHECTVLDFVLNHRKEFRYDKRFRSLLGTSRRQTETQIQENFPFLPAGCFMTLDAVAKERILDSLKYSVARTWKQRIVELQQCDNENITLAEFLEQSGLELEDVYANGRCWSDLQAAAGYEIQDPGPDEIPMRKAIGRLLHVDDDERLVQWSDWLEQADSLDISLLGDRNRRLLRMLVTSLVRKSLSRDASISDGWSHIVQHKQIIREMLELITVLNARVDHLHSRLEERAETPLQVHARYTRLEILAATEDADLARVPEWREGTRNAKQCKADLLAFTLDKSAGNFSPTTRYRDYAISRKLIHWESQSMTREDSETGMRYQTHAGIGQAILLFARESTNERAFWFLGSARYQSHSGERPMAIRWELTKALPGDLFAQFSAAVA